ncbi:MAG: OadG family protein [Actinobacteria bacterium]|nr:OadG family protein [Actinomycetota bacterium]
MFEGIGGAILLAILDYLYIFVVLGGLAIVMVLLGKIVKRFESKKTHKEIKVTSPVINTALIKEKEKFNGELIAVITAAMVFYLKKPKSKFKIVNIKRYRPFITTPWSSMGRQNVMLGKNININLGGRFIK